VGTELEIRSMHETGGDCLCGSSKLSASELITDLFSREAERARDSCTFTSHLPPVTSLKCLEG
jgi:hypothetical protein